MGAMKLEGTFFAAAALVAACSSSSGSAVSPSSADSGSPASIADAGGSGDAAAGACPLSPVTWKDDGTQECASNAEAIRMSSTGASMTDTLEIVVTQLNITTGLSIVISSPTTLGGSYDCVVSPSSVVEITYYDPAANSTVVQSCAVTLAFTASDAGVTAAVGTFSVMLTIPDGGTKSLTEGVFDVPVTNE